ncbi:MAG: tryptophan--tRNA ligase [Ruminiclostridium sp.]|nr:tryptophan--tRNA ligase [Ruminiclostridium sp.]
MEETIAKKRILSAIQPTNTPTLGNYLGALVNWIKLQNEYDCAYCIADLHSITVRQDPQKLRKQITESYALLLAMGVDPQKSIAFIQGHNPAHAELSWVLSCYTQFGELSRMTQFKDKSEKHPENINAGLFTYPVLMAADILLYQADLVPVGVDQKQHIELARNIAQRFNSVYGDTFTMPEPYITKTTAKIMSLQDPTKKMSKSDENPNACISILDDKDTIVRKFKRAVTDSEAEVAYREGKDGINNLMSIYSAVTDKSFEEIEKEFAGKGYGDFKLAVGEATADMLAPMQAEFGRIISDKKYIEQCMKEGAEKAYKASRRTLQKVYKKVGFVELPR